MTEQPQAIPPQPQPTPPPIPIPNAEDAILSKLLENLPSTDAVELNLPSKNKFYNFIDPSKGLSIKPLTFDDEKELVSRRNATGDILNILLKKCVSNIQISDLLIIDKLYIIMKIRELSYGDDYKATLSCPSCKTENNVTFVLSQLGAKYVEEDATNPVTVELPILKKRAKVRLPRISDEAYLVNNEQTMNNLWRFVEEIEGHTKKTIIAKVISSLPLRDAHTILAALGGGDVGINTEVRFICNYCDYNENISLPITGDFFTGN